MSGGTPTLTLNDGGIATYTSGSGSNALTFSYTVAAGQNTAALAATAVNLNSATVTDGAGNAANLSLTGLTQSGPQIDTTTPTISSLAESPSPAAISTPARPSRSRSTSSEAVTVTGGTPTLTLNDGGTATYTGGSGSNALTFSYTVGAGAEHCFDLSSHQAQPQTAATITDGAGNAANLSLTGLTQSGPQIDTTTPTISSLTESPSSGDLNAGKTVTLTLNLNEAVTVAGGTPTLTLNDGGTATYTRRLRQQCADLQLHRRRRTEHRGPRRHRRQSQFRNRHRRRRQRRQSLAHRPDPERPADRHNKPLCHSGLGFAIKRS